MTIWFKSSPKALLKLIIQHLLPFFMCYLRFIQIRPFGKSLFHLLQHSELLQPFHSILVLNLLSILSHFIEVFTRKARLFLMYFVLLLISFTTFLALPLITQLFEVVALKHFLQQFLSLLFPLFKVQLQLQALILRSFLQFFRLIIVFTLFINFKVFLVEVLDSFLQL